MKQFLSVSVKVYRSSDNSSEPLFVTTLSFLPEKILSDGNYAENPTPVFPVMPLEGIRKSMISIARATYGEDSYVVVFNRC